VLVMKLLYNYILWTARNSFICAFQRCYGCGGGIRNNTLTNETITVGVNQFEGYQTYSFYTNCTDEPDGSVFRFVTDFAEQYGLGIKEIDADLTPTQCLAVLANNTVDACIGPVWTTNSRRAIYDFSLPFYFEDFYMISHIKDEETTFFQALIFNPLKPFSWRLWIYFFLTLALLGFANFIIRQSPHERFKSLKGYSICNLWNGIVLSVVHSVVRVNFKYTHKLLKLSNGFVHLHFYSIKRKCLSGESFEVNEKSSISDHLLIFGIIVFSVLFITGYGANYTAGLINGGDRPEYNSFSEAIENNATVCIPRQIEQELTFLYPELSNYFLGFNIPQNVLDGICDVGIISSFVFEEFVLAEWGNLTEKELCNEMVMIYEEDPIITIPNSLALSRNFTSTELGAEFLRTLDFYIGSNVYVELLDPLNYFI